MEQCAQAGDRLVLALETIFARDQHIVESGTWRRQIDEREFRERIRFDLDWGYDWAPFFEMLSTAREFAEGLYGLDCMPREDLRKIGARDRHAAHKIAEIRQRASDAIIFVLMVVSRISTGHLPQSVREQDPNARMLTVLTLTLSTGRAAGERR